MSVIYLKSAITKDPDDFEKCKKSFNSKILIYFEEQRSKKSDEREDVKVDDFSLDITLGHSWNQDYSYNDTSLYTIEGDEIKIAPRSSVVVRIREFIRVPNNRFGMVLSTGSLFLQSGVQSAIAKIEPGYSGTLVLRLTNTSSNVARIKKGEKIASVIFLETNHTPSYTAAENSRRISEEKATRFKRFSFWMVRESHRLMVFSQIAIAVATVFAAIFAGISFGMKLLEMWR